MSRLDDIFKKLDGRIINGIAISIARDESYDTDPMLNDAKAEVADMIAEAYKKGHIDGSIEVVNNTCELCHAYPMTVDCNNAGCDK